MAPRPALRPALVALGVTSAMLLTACGNEGGGGGGASETGPLDAYFEQIWGDWSPEQWEDEQRRAEELTAECMAELGFDYIPQENSGMVISGDEDEEWDAAKYAAEYGYGIFSWQEASEEELAQQDEWTDPNEEYVNAMSDSERDAYYLALHGDWDSIEWDEDGSPLEEIDHSQMGCQGAAQAEASGSQVYDAEEFETLNVALERLWDESSDDPRIREADAAWADCMADAGYSQYANPREPMEYFMDQQEVVYEEQNALYDELDEDDPRWEDPEFLDMLSGGAPEEIKELERDTAVADHACQQDVGYEKVRTEVQFEKEEQFIADNKDLLDRILELHAQAGD